MGGFGSAEDQIFNRQQGNKLDTPAELSRDNRTGNVRFVQFLTVCVGVDVGVFVKPA
jgi:hypothetical protein